MADLTGVTTNYIPTAHETFEDTLSASCLAGATTVFITNLGEYNDGDIVVLTVDPGTANEATFTGVKQSAPYRVTDVEWTEGNTAVGHNSGATVIDYDSATHYNMITKLLKLLINQDGTFKTQPIRDALGLGSDAANGWEALGYAPNTIVDNGNGSYTATFNGVDLTGITGVGDRMLLPRAATNTQCATFDGVNDYFSKATPNKMTWTDDFTFSVWLKPSAYSVNSVIFSRYNGTSGFDIKHGALGAADGRVQVIGFNAGAANYSEVHSSTSLVLNRWTHVAGLLDMSAFTAAAATAETAKSWIMFNGIEQPAVVTRAGTNPTTLIQAGNLEIGAENGGTNFYTGRMAQLAVYNTRVLQATIRASRNQPLTGSETSLASAYSFNNSIVDLNTTTPNDLTANGGVVATTNDTPFTNPVTGTNLTAGTRNYAIIVGQTFSTNTVYTLQVAEGDTIPTTTPPTSVSYSKQKNPYGFSSDITKWAIQYYYSSLTTGFAPVSTTWYNLTQISLPVGSFVFGYQAESLRCAATFTAATYVSGAAVLSVTSANAGTTDEIRKWKSTCGIDVYGTAAAPTTASSSSNRYGNLTLTSQTTYYMNYMQQSGGTSLNSGNGFNGALLIEAIPVWV